MVSNRLDEVIQYLRTAALLREGAGLTDGQLLTDYLSHHDEAALAALVRRHGPMVWGVCRRVLRDYHDAEDAFQATFLVLVRKAASIASRELLANWLYGVAHRTALKAKATAARRKGRERQVAQMPEPALAEPDLWRDLQPLLDEELSHLPAKYRAIIVLCDLEGKTRQEAARQLGVPEGTVAGWLARARAMLAKRLARRGVALSGGVLAAVLSQKVVSAGVPNSVVSSTIKAASLVAAGQAAGMISVKVAALTEGVVNAMLLTKLKVAMAVVLMIAALAGATGLIYQTQAAEEPKEKQEPPSANKDQNKGEEKQAIGKKEKLWVLIDKVLAAHGGEEKLSKLKFIEEMETPNLPDPVSVTYFVQPPERFREHVTHTGVKYLVLPPVRFREEVKHAELTTSTRIHILQKDGMKRWTTYPKIEKEQWGGPDPMIDYWSDYVKFFGPRRVLRLKDADHRVARLDEVKIDGRPAVGVELTKTVPKFKMSLKMYFDKETNLLAKEENDFSYSAIIYPPLGYTPQWSPHEEKVHSSSAIFYTDYKKFDGIPLAQKEIHTANGKYVSETKVTAFKVVKDLDAKLFEQP